MDRPTTTPARAEQVTCSADSSKQQLHRCSKLYTSILQLQKRTSTALQLMRQMPPLHCSLAAAEAAAASYTASRWLSVRCLRSSGFTCNVWLVMLLMLLSHNSAAAAATLSAGDSTAGAALQRQLLQSGEMAMPCLGALEAVFRSGIPNYRGWAG